MIELVGMVLSILGPLFSWGIKKIINSGKVEGEAKKRLEDAYTALSRIRRKELNKARELENELPKMDKEMEEIESGKQDWPNDRKESD